MNSRLKVVAPVLAASALYAYFLSACGPAVSEEPPMGDPYAAGATGAAKATTGGGGGGATGSSMPVYFLSGSNGTGTAGAASAASGSAATGGNRAVAGTAGTAGNPVRITATSGTTGTPGAAGGSTAPVVITPVVITSTSGSTATTTTPATSAAVKYAGTRTDKSVVFVDGKGTAPSGATSAATGTGGAASSTPAGAAVWTGYAYTYKYGSGTTTPVCDGKTACFTGAQLCATGTVPADDDSGAGIGWDISTAGVAITGDVKVHIAGAPANMRVSLTGVDAKKTEYCTLLPAGAATALTAIPASDFKTNCWDTSGVAYAGQPIKSIQFAVPGSKAGTASTFDFCVIDVEPG